MYGGIVSNIQVRGTHLMLTNENVNQDIETKGQMCVRVGEGGGGEGA